MMNDEIEKKNYKRLKKSKQIGNQKNEDQI